MTPRIHMHLSLLKTLDQLQAAILYDRNDRDADRPLLGHKYCSVLSQRRRWSSSFKNIPRTEVIDGIEDASKNFKFSYLSGIYLSYSLEFLSGEQNASGTNRNYSFYLLSWNLYMPAHTGPQFCSPTIFNWDATFFNRCTNLFNGDACNFHQ